MDQEAWFSLFIKKHLYMFLKAYLYSAQQIIPWARLNVKTIFSQVWDSHVKDKTVTRPSYL